MTNHLIACLTFNKNSNIVSSLFLDAYLLVMSPVSKISNKFGCHIKVRLFLFVAGSVTK